jgi:hypothetical protein
MDKPILCLDFDGVIHSYSSGWQGAALIPDRPVPGAIEFIYNAVEHFRVAVFSSRSNQTGGLAAMRGWLRAFLLHEIADGEDVERVFSMIEWPLEKPAAFLTIDDRALTFDGTWPSVETIKAFKPWNKKNG